MKKLFFIVCNYLILLPVLLGLVSLYSMEADNYRKYTHPWFIADFHERLQSYLQSSKTSPQAVMAGPGYAVALKEFGPIYNIALGGTGQSEIAAIIRKYCRKTDRILYAVTIWDFMADGSALHNQAVYDSWRRLFLLHEHISPSKEPPDEMWLDSYWHNIKVWVSEIEMLENAIASQGVEHDGEMIALLIRRLKHNGPAIKGFGKFIYTVSR